MQFNFHGKEFTARLESYISIWELENKSYSPEYAQKYLMDKLKELQNWRVSFYHEGETVIYGRTYSGFQIKVDHNGQGYVWANGITEAARKALQTYVDEAAAVAPHIRSALILEQETKLREDVIKLAQRYRRWADEMERAVSYQHPENNC